MTVQRPGYWTEAPSSATFDILERYAAEHPELKAGFSRSTGGVDIDQVVAVFANDLRAARRALRGPLSVEKCSECGNNWNGAHDDWCPFKTPESRKVHESRSAPDQNENRLHSVAVIITAAFEDLVKEHEAAKREALSLAKALHEQEYSHVTEWVPDDNVVGLILQISNMAAGLSDQIWSLREEIKDFRRNPVPSARDASDNIEKATTGHVKVHNGRLVEIVNDADNFYRPEIKSMALELLSLREEIEGFRSNPARSTVG